MTKHDLNKSIHHFITPVETAIREGCTVEMALNSLRGRNIKSDIIYFYVVDENYNLVGIVPTRKLLLSNPEEKISSLMNKSIITLDGNTNLKHALETFEKKRLLAIPVTNSEGKLLGSLDMRLYSEEHSDAIERTDIRQDLFRLIGIQAEQLKRSSSLKEFSLRFPWLIFNIIGGLCCAFIISFFETTLARAVLLSMFLPLVLALSESISIQSMTIALSYLHKAKMPWILLRSSIKKELKVASMIGFTCGFITILFALIFNKGHLVPVVIGLSILISMLVTAVLGILFPIILNIFKLDPKIACPVVLVFGDIFTTFTYLLIANSFLNITN